MTHIHLLPKNAFVNQAPRLLVIEALAKETADRTFKFMGGNPIVTI